MQGSNYKNRNYSRYPSNNRTPRNVKHSGASEIIFKDGKSLKGTKGLTAWNYSKEKGMVTVLVFQTKYSDELTKNGNQKFAAKITFKRTGQTVIKTAVQSAKNGKMYIPSLNWVVNPKAPNGGYCGQSKRP